MIFTKYRDPDQFHDSSHLRECARRRITATTIFGIILLAAWGIGWLYYAGHLDKIFKH